jgi:hypothetical protein
MIDSIIYEVITIDEIFLSYTNPYIDNLIKSSLSSLPGLACRICGPRKGLAFGRYTASTHGINIGKLRRK